MPTRLRSTRLRSTRLRSTRLSSARCLVSVGPPLDGRVFLGSPRRPRRPNLGTRRTGWGLGSKARLPLFFRPNKPQRAAPADIQASRVFRLPTDGSYQPGVVGLDRSAVGHKAHSELAGRVVAFADGLALWARLVSTSPQASQEFPLRVWETLFRRIRPAVLQGLAPGPLAMACQLLSSLHPRSSNVHNSDLPAHIRSLSEARAKRGRFRGL